MSKKSARRFQSALLTRMSTRPAAQRLRDKPLTIRDFTDVGLNGDAVRRAP